MITSITPLRVSLFGGGTDFPEFFKNNKAVIIGGTIDKYIYISFNKYYSNFFKHKLKFFYNRLEFVNSPKFIKHPVIKEVFIKEKINSNLEVHIAADLPSSAGLGSSSAFATGLINIVNAFKKKKISKNKLVKKIIFLERNRLRENVGYQDQIFSTFGGFGKITINRNSKIDFKKYDLDTTKKIQKNLFLVFTGIQRSANKIEKIKILKIKKNIELLKKIQKIALDSNRIILSKKNLDILGKNLDRTWKIKKKLDSRVSNKVIDKIYTYGIKSGALGGKLLGAGAGGFILFYVPKKKHKEFISKNKNKIISFNFVRNGSRILRYS